MKEYTEEVLQCLLIVRGLVRIRHANFNEQLMKNPSDLRILLCPFFFLKKKMFYSLQTPVL